MTDRRNMTIYHILFSLAVVSVVLGAGLLLMTTGQVSGPRALSPLVFIIAGSLYSYFAIAFKVRAKFVFLGLMTACVALIRFVATVFGISAGDYWPLFAIAAGVCILSVNYIHYGKAKPSAIVISSAFVLLGLFLSIFSFGFSSMRFKTFITLWWPGLFIASGLVLLIVWWIQRLILKNEPASEPYASDSGNDDRGKE